MFFFLPSGPLQYLCKYYPDKNLENKYSNTKASNQEILYFNNDMEWKIYFPYLGPNGDSI